MFGTELKNDPLGGMFPGTFRGMFFVRKDMKVLGAAGTLTMGIVVTMRVYVVPSRTVAAVLTRTRTRTRIAVRMMLAIGDVVIARTHTKAAHCTFRPTNVRHTQEKRIVRTEGRAIFQRVCVRAGSAVETMMYVHVSVHTHALPCACTYSHVSTCIHLRAYFTIILKISFVTLTSYATSRT